LPALPFIWDGENDCLQIDERTLNLFILAGQSEEIEFEIQIDGSIEP
jgi:hypothetical protein